VLTVVVFDLKAGVEVSRPAHVFMLLLKTTVKGEVEVVNVKALRLRYYY
jgi:uncharacterized protein with GYD domain